jgi:hypothetical protein
MGWELWDGFVWLRTGNSCGHPDQGNELSVSIRDGKFLEQLNGYYLFKDCGPYKAG